MNGTFEERRDMHFVYGLADGNAHLAARLYAERFPGRYHPDHRVFINIHRGLGEYGTLGRHNDVVGRPRNRRTPEFEEAVLQHFEQNPSTSTRAVANQLGSSNSTVWSVMNDDGQHPFHLQKVQGLTPNDYEPRVHFDQWLLQNCNEVPDFPGLILFTDECCFARDGYFNFHNSHIWAADNPHATHVDGNQHKFSVNMWAGIIGDHLLGPVELPARLNGQAYLYFLQNTLPVLMEDLPLELRLRMWYQHDGAPAHFFRLVRNHIRAVFGRRCIGRGLAVPWPARSPDKTPCDFFLWGFFKDVVYATPVETREDLLERIHNAARQLRERPEIFRRVRESLVRRSRLCLEVQGRHFEHLL